MVMIFKHIDTHTHNIIHTVPIENQACSNDKPLGQDCFGDFQFKELKKC